MGVPFTRHPSHDTLTIYPSHDTLTIYPSHRYPSHDTLHTDTLHTTPFTRHPYYIPFTLFLTIYPSHRYPSHRYPYSQSLLSLYISFQISVHTTHHLSFYYTTLIHTTPFDISNYNKNIQDITRIFLFHLLIFSFSFFSSFLFYILLFYPLFYDENVSGSKEFDLLAHFFVNSYL